jgi:hypothetical protein
MMKRPSKRVIGVIAVVVALLVSFTVGRLYESRSGVTHLAGCNSFDEGGCHPEPESFWNQTTDDPITFFTFILAIVGVFTLGTIGVQLYWMEQADEQTRKEFEATHRPWILITVAVASDFEWSPMLNVNGRIKISVTAKNIGEGPARLVRGTVALHSGHFSEGDVLQAQEQIASKFLTTESTMGRTLFPNDSTTLETFVIPIGFELTQKWKAWFEPFRGIPDSVLATTAPSATIIGCVIYRSTFGDVAYQTGFIRDISRVTHPSAVREIIKPDRGTISQTELRISNSNLGDGVIT